MISHLVICFIAVQLYVLSYIHLYYCFDISYYLLLFNLLDPLKTVAVLYADVIGWDTRTLNANDHFSIISWAISIGSNVISFDILYHFFLRNPDKSKQS